MSSETVLKRPELADCAERISKWLAEPTIDTEAKKEIEQLIASENIVELRDRFYRELEFGTGGLRGVVGAGNNRINKYVVRRATQGLCNQMRKVVGEGGTARVAIAHDSRLTSELYSREAACVIAANGFEAYLFPTLETTPCLSFAVRHLKCLSGICVTASHNPAQYNGFKVYWDDGAQVTPPVDKQVLESVLAIQNFSDAKYISFEDAVKTGRAHFIEDSVVSAYFKEVAKLQLYPHQSKDVGIVYTPLHGTGGKPVRRALTEWGYNQLTIVPEQEKPDGRFPTVKKPNPEEPEALKMAIDLAARIKAKIVVASDPDSDRLALAVWDPKAAQGLLRAQAFGEYVLLNGNQTGALMIDYILSGSQALGRLTPNDAIVKTIVTSELHARLAKSFKVETFNTLTGFKWIAGLVRSWETQGLKHRYLFGTEESFGFMPGLYVRDKDGVAALCQAVEMTAHLQANGQTPCDRLFELFKQFGAWQEDLMNFDLVGEEGAARIGRVMQAVRQNPPAELAGARVDKVIDYKNQETGLPKSDVLQFDLSDGSRVSMRPSGTEPKLKIYISVCTDVAGGKVEDVYPQTCDRVVKLRAQMQARIDAIC